MLGICFSSTWPRHGRGLPRPVRRPRRYRLCGRTRSAARASSAGRSRSVDIRNDDIQSGDVKDNSIKTFDVHSFLGADVARRSLAGGDIGIPQVTGSGWEIQIGVVNAELVSTYRSLNGLDGYSDHLDHIFIQPHFSNSSFSLIYTAEPGASHSRI